MKHKKNIRKQNDESNDGKEDNEEDHDISEEIEDGDGDDGSSIVAAASGLHPMLETASATQGLWFMLVFDTFLYSDFNSSKALTDSRKTYSLNLGHQKMLHLAFHLSILHHASPTVPPTPPSTVAAAVAAAEAIKNKINLLKMADMAGGSGENNPLSGGAKELRALKKSLHVRKDVGPSRR